MTRRTTAALALALAAALAAPALAQEAPKQEPAKDAAQDPAAGAPRRFVTVKYVHGGSVRGVIEAGVLWEKRDADGKWVPAKAGERGASLRVAYVDGVDGSVVLPGERVKEVVVDGPCTDAQLDKIRDGIAASAAKAAEARRAAAEKRAADEKRAAEERAAAEKAKAETPAPKADGTAPAAPADKPAADTVDPATRKRWTDLLVKYPPSKWTPETPDEIQRRFIVRHLPATKEEREFLAVFEEWKPAYLDWKKSQPVAPAAPAAPK